MSDYPASPESDDAYQDHQAELANAIAKVSDAAFVTQYVVVAAVTHPNGEDSTHLITSPNLPLWQTHGLLSYEAAATAPQPTWTLKEDG